ncbi:uncharacterized protein PHACADRAFT_260977 [Phanerochaete carnosa HHB-10118-sp]|uniref:BTB domain-containing protein n=1 Tax=Phanerochaete carnosa (strain HHB-10118-sp) TaxID=650164 RepID=K5W0V9_PHACS|nr:uncharacterized protein PHACADRAFT_260977 [Phanerochaete carnosa HHB-10118-sp]EKM52514.1 hypothetical protein PHACADRAFT_260977 [Phanerochaete carnosa HHB-10118-sp]
MSNNQGKRATAAHPFNIDNADVVFTTSDAVDFRVYKSILSVASPFFHAMFSLKQPASLGSPEPISVSEESEVFDALLRLCYPVDDPTFADLSQLEPVLEAAIKYQLDEASKLACSLLCGFAAAESLHVFAIACRLQLDKEALLAASMWKTSRNFNESSSNFSDTVAGACYTSDMPNITAACFYRLLQFCRGTPMPGLSSFISRCATSLPPYLRQQDNTDIDLLFDGDQADVVLRSTDGVQFRAHTLLFRLSGATVILDEGSCQSAPDANLPIVKVQLDSETLADLIRMVAPSPCSVSITDSRRLWSLAQVATRYEIPRIAAALKKEVRRLTPDRGLAVYLLAAAHGWKEEAELAARALAHRSLGDVYDSLMEDVSAAVYHSLLQFHHQCVVAMSEVIQQRVEGGHKQWKELSHARSATRPISVILPVVEKELYPFATASNGPCRGCGSSNTYSSNHKSCGYKVSPLLLSSEEVERALDARLSEVSTLC